MIRSGSKVAIGVFGGSFDPPHLGHLIIAEEVAESCGLDVVMFVPAFQSPHKMGNSTASPAHRVAMTRLAIKGNKHFKVWDYEIRKRGISYTVDTLRALRQQNPSASLFLILGSDSYGELPTWRSPEEIVSMASLIVYPRSGYGKERGIPRAEFLRGTLIDISSSKIRRRVREGLSIRYMVPEGVARYIRSKKLYASRGQAMNE